MTSALVSLLTGRPVRPSVGMTGEVTLQGRVLPIGGVKQKVLAAHRAGLTEVILPMRNGPDLEDLPASVRAAMTFHLAESISEVLAVALESDEADGLGSRSGASLGRCLSETGLGRLVGSGVEALGDAPRDRLERGQLRRSSARRSTSARTDATWSGAASTSFLRPFAVSVATELRPTPAHRRRTTKPLASSLETAWERRESDALVPRASSDMRAVPSPESERAARIWYSKNVSSDCFRVAGVEDRGQGEEQPAELDPRRVLPWRQPAVPCSAVACRAHRRPSPSACRMIVEPSTIIRRTR